MASAFNLLTAGGARFDKSRFGHDIELFGGKSLKSKDKGKAKAEPSNPLPHSLNMFSNSTTPHHPHHAPARRPARDQSPKHDEGGESDSSSSSSSSSRPAPPKQKITITGSDPLPTSLHSNLPSLTSHSTTPLSSSAGKPLLKALQSASIHGLWGVQCAVAGCLLEGRDTMCIAPTGSGKTLAYLLPTIVALRDPVRVLREQGDGEGTDEGKGIRAVVLVPTHDLAVQIHGVLKAITHGRSWRCLVLSKATQKAVCESAPGAGFAKDKSEKADGEDAASDEVDEDEADEESTGSVDEFAPNNVETDALGIDILIATPERLHHLLESQQLSLSKTRHLILDESDRLFSPDFLPQVEPVIEACTHKEVQKCFLSATMPSGAEELGRRWLRDGGVRVVVGLKDSAVTTISQSLLYTASEPGKLLALQNLISTGQLPYPSLIFVQSIERANELHKTLVLDGLRCEVVHSSRGKAARDEAIKGFREGRVWVLVVTEVLARGMDFRGVKVVVNYDFPQTVQSYIHRVGRTGRAGRPGKAITFFSNEDGPYLRTIANVLRASGCPVPPYMLDLQPPSKNTKRQLAKAPPKRKAVGGGGRDVGKEDGKKRREMKDGSKRRKMKDGKNGKDAKDGQAGRADGMKGKKGEVDMDE